MHWQWGDRLNIILYQIHNPCFHCIFRGFVGIVHAQLSEYVLAVAVYGVEAEISFGCNLLGGFS